MDTLANDVEMNPLPSNRGTKRPKNGKRSRNRNAKQVNGSQYIDGYNTNSMNLESEVDLISKPVLAQSGKIST